MFRKRLVVYMAGGVGQGLDQFHQQYRKLPTYEEVCAEAAKDGYDRYPLVSNELFERVARGMSDDQEKPWSYDADEAFSRLKFIHQLLAWRDYLEAISQLSWNKPAEVAFQGLSLLETRKKIQEAQNMTAKKRRPSGQSINGELNKTILFEQTDQAERRTTEILKKWWSDVVGIANALCGRKSKEVSGSDLYHLCGMSPQLVRNLKPK
jgi:hypothetical protein